MKFFIFLAAGFVVVASWAPPTMQDYTKYNEECAKSGNVSQSESEKLSRHQLAENLSQESKCFVRCVGIKSGIWDDTNGYNIERSYQNIQTVGINISMESLKKCCTPNADNEDKCAWAARNMRCLEMYIHERKLKN